MKKKIILIFFTVLMLSSISFAQESSQERPEFQITSSAFGSGAVIPTKYTCEGANISPPLQIDNAPANAKSFALIVDDPDAPGGMWVHWVVWNISPKTKQISENRVPRGAKQGMNDFKKNSYGGPCPPSGTHRYYFKLYALDAVLQLDANAKKSDLENAMKGHVIREAQLVGRYAKNKQVRE